MYNQRMFAQSKKIDLLEALQFGLNKVSSAEINYSGSSTVCMASLNSTNSILVSLILVTADVCSFGGWIPKVPTGALYSPYGGGI